MFTFPTVGLLITHYNRSRSLEHLLVSFENLNCKFGQIVVSDDGSEPEHRDYLNYLQTQFEFDLVSVESNQGLGNNINKGQDAVSTPFTLYVQEDFEPSELFPEKLKDGLGFMKEDQGLDMVRFYAYSMYPYLTPFRNGFSKMHMRPFGFKYKKIHYYSDHPHLRRSTFFDKFGRYTEGTIVDVTEYNMSVAFIKNKGVGLFYNDHYSLFTQINSTMEPSTVPWNERKKGTDFVSKVRRFIHRQIKYNYDIYFKKIDSETINVK